MASVQLAPLPTVDDWGAVEGDEWDDEPLAAVALPASRPTPGIEDGGDDGDDEGGSGGDMEDSGGGGDPSPDDDASQEASPDQDFEDVADRRSATSELWSQLSGQEDDNADTDLAEDQSVRWADDPAANGRRDHAAELNRLVTDPRYLSDQNYTDYVTNQFERAYGDGRDDGTGRFASEVRSDFSGVERYEPPVRDDEDRGAEPQDDIRAEVAAWVERKRAGTSTMTDVAEHQDLLPAAKRAEADRVREPPAEKADVLKRQLGVWEKFNRTLQRDSDLTDAEKEIYPDIFAWEGGIEPDPRNGASSGITKTMLNTLKDRNAVQGLSKRTTPVQLTMQQRVEVYSEYFDYAFRTVGGVDVLDNMGVPGAAAAFADTIFTHGSRDGTLALQNAMNDVFREHGFPIIRLDGQMGPGVARPYQFLASDEALARELSDRLIYWRSQAPGGIEPGHIRYFRFPR